MNSCSREQPLQHGRELEVFRLRLDFTTRTYFQVQSSLEIQPGEQEFTTTIERSLINRVTAWRTW